MHELTSAGPPDGATYTLLPHRLRVRSYAHTLHSLLITAFNQLKLHIRMKRILLVLALVGFACSIALAQRTVSGTVFDANGEPLIGASVLVQNTTSGTVTDIDGNFSLGRTGRCRKPAC